MKVGIFADIHGNIYAFEKVWESLKRKACDLYCFAGDICGYYYYQDEIAECLRGAANLVCVRGNHDDAFLRGLRNRELSKEYSLQYGKANLLLAEKINPATLEFLEGLPDEYISTEYNFGMFHGSPWDKLNKYVYPDDPLEKFRDLPYAAVILGHTHYPMHKNINGVQLINPGSAGQPRDTNAPSYATFDTQARDVKIKRVEYDYQAMANDVKGRGEEGRYLYNVLMAL